VLGSPDLPSLDEVCVHYDIPFRRYGVLIMHPVTTEPGLNRSNAAVVVDAVLADGGSFVVIDSNNDEGCVDVRRELDRLVGPRFVRLPSMRFEFFVTLMREAEMVLGNSSAGVREAPVLGTPSVNVGSRQRDRSAAPSVLHAEASVAAVGGAIAAARALGRCAAHNDFGERGARQRIVELLEGESLWRPSLYKTFVDAP
jgi:UDP-N-acetylglucosamine 2-epimerase (hydrolysing)